jgi:hypothetical protein
MDTNCCPLPQLGTMIAREQIRSKLSQFRPISLFRKDNPFPNLRGVSDTVLEEWSKINSGLDAHLSPLQWMNLNHSQRELSELPNILWSRRV